MGSIEDANNTFEEWQTCLRDYQGMVVEGRNAYVDGAKLAEEIISTYGNLKSLLESYVDLMDDHRIVMHDAGKLFESVCKSITVSGMPEQPPYTILIQHLLAAHPYYKKVGAPTNYQEAAIVSERVTELDGMVSVLGSRAEKVEDNSLGALREVEGAVQIIEAFKKDI